MESFKTLFCSICLIYAFINVINCNGDIPNLKVDHLPTVQRWEDWTHLINGGEVLLVKKPMNWHDAQDYCIERNSRLLTFPFSVECKTNNKDFLGKLPIGTKLWSGLFNAGGKWIWSHSYDGEHLSLHAEKDEKCAAIKLNGMQGSNFVLALKAENCESEKSFICERMQDVCNDNSQSLAHGYIKDPNQKTFYYISKHKLEYDNAQIHCNIMSANLPSIVSPSEQSFVGKLIKNSYTSLSDRIWLDAMLYHEKEFCWNSFYGFVYQKFMAYEGKCVSMVKSGDNKWISDLCEKRFHVVCQRRCGVLPKPGKCHGNIPNIDDVLEK